MGDRYASFAELSAKEKRGEAWEIRSAARDSAILLLAPHGGLIEPGTSQIARGIAADTRSFYCFEGLQKRPHGDLHIKSERFDEPAALALLAASEVAVAIHGRADRDDPSTILMGGRATLLRDTISARLAADGFGTAVAGGHLAGLSSANICNKAGSGAGVQLELPKTLRDLLLADPDHLQAFCEAVRSVLPE